MATRTLAFEIGTEEIPAFNLKDATAALQGLMETSLEDARIAHGEIEIFSTPRRLDIIAYDVEEQTTAIVEEYKGPSVKIAFDESGAPTRAGEGFARGKGIDASQLEKREVDGTEYVFAVISVPSRKTEELLPGILLGIINSLSWPKSMRWNIHHELFTRPVRWLLALFGDEVIHIEYAGIESGREVWGHRVLSAGPHEVSSADELVKTLHLLNIVPSQQERADIIYSGVAEIEKKHPGCNVVLPEKTLTEVINLSEYPTVLLGRFDEKFLEVPEEIIVDAMLMHQRYFPIYKDGKLTNMFIIVSNGDETYSEQIVDGNERVVAARLYDARFFYQEDLKRPLEDYVARLDEVVFQEKLGTMRDKTSRIEQLSERICLDMTLEATEKENVARAARLAKADLVTNAVIEFTSVQGIIGSYYALASGENETVATAVAQHYRPRFAGDEVPTDIVGRVVAISDKIDTICGLFALGQGPTGTSDPFALRRAALGTIAILMAGVDVSLEKLIGESLDIYLESGLEFDKKATLDAVMEFFVTRTKVMLKDAGNDARVVEAVLATGQREPMAIIERTEALSTAMKDDPETFEDLSVAFSRADNLRDAECGLDVDSSLFNEDEAKLSYAIDKVSTDVNIALDQKLYSVALKELAKLREPIDSFFESTMVMDEDATLRANRIKLLNRFVAAFDDMADFSLIPR